MTIYQLKQLLEEFPNDAEVVVSMYSCGSTFQEDLDYWRVEFLDGKLVINAEDN